MGYCGECEHWKLKVASEENRTKDMGVCEVSGIEAGKMRHGCIMFAQRRNLEESGRSPIENYKLAQANERK